MASASGSSERGKSIRFGCSFRRRSCASRSETKSSRGSQLHWQLELNGTRPSGGQLHVPVVASFETNRPSGATHPSSSRPHPCIQALESMAWSTAMSISLTTPYQDIHQKRLLGSSPSIKHKHHVTRTHKINSKTQGYTLLKTQEGGTPSLVFPLLFPFYSPLRCPDK